MPGDFAFLNFDAPFILRDADRLSLHFTIGELQSSMCLDRPEELQLDYTRTMMGFLLLQPRPGHIAMVGLGGGSLVKFCHRHLLSSRMTVVENNPGVIALRQAFAIPDDDERLSVVAGDGAAFVRDQAGLELDVLLVDGFDSGGQPPALCSQAFYNDCFRALAPGGVLVVNLHADHPGHGEFIDRLARSFKGNLMQVPSTDKSNCVVFAGRKRPVTLQALRSCKWAGELSAPVQRQLRGEFAQIGWHASRVGAN